MKKPSGVSTAVGDLLDSQPIAESVTSRAARFYEVGRSLPGLFQDTARQAHDAVTWELSQNTSGLFPHPQTDTGVAYIIGLVGSRSQRYEVVNRSHTQTLTGFAGGTVTMTATATGSRGPSSSDVTAKLTGNYRGTSVFTDDGALNTNFTVTFKQGQSPVIASDGLWTGTGLLYEGDNGRTDYFYRQSATGVADWGGSFNYAANNLDVYGSELRMNGNSAGRDSKILQSNGDFAFITPIPGGGSMSVTSNGSYANQLFRVISEARTELRGVAAVNDRLTATVRIEVGSAVSTPTATVTLGYTGTGVFGASDRYSFGAGASARRGVPVGIAIRGNYNLMGLGESVTATFELGPNNMGLSTTPSASLYYNYGHFGAIGIGVQGTDSLNFSLSRRW